MISDTDICQRLNLVRNSGSFVLKETGTQGEADVLSLNQIPKNNGIYWLGGKTVLKSGRELESVFRVDTDTGGTLVSVYWLINGGWHMHEEESALNALGLAKDDVFPFDWSYSIELEEDNFHDK